MTSTTFFIIFIPILSILLLSINLLLAPHNPYQEKDSPFECGFHSFSYQNRTQFSISFFIFALLFLLFDLEIVLIYPFSVSSYNNDIYGLVVMIVFFILLTIGFIFELGKNALTIDSKQTLLLLDNRVPDTDIFIGFHLKSNTCILDLLHNLALFFLEANGDCFRTESPDELAELMYNFHVNTPLPLGRLPGVDSLHYFIEHSRELNTYIDYAYYLESNVWMASGTLKSLEANIEIPGLICENGYDVGRTLLMNIIHGLDGIVYILRESHTSIIRSGVHATHLHSVIDTMFKLEVANCKFAHFLSDFLGPNYNLAFTSPFIDVYRDLPGDYILPVENKTTGIIPELLESPLYPSWWAEIVDILNRRGCREFLEFLNRSVGEDYQSSIAAIADSEYYSGTSEPQSEQNTDKKSLENNTLITSDSNNNDHTGSTSTGKFNRDTIGSASRPETTFEAQSRRFALGQGNQNRIGFASNSQPEIDLKRSTSPGVDNNSIKRISGGTPPLSIMPKK